MLYIELSVVLLMILFNGILAMSELSIVSSRRSRLEHLAEQGSRRAGTAIDLIDNPNRFLSTVQIGITLVGIGAGAFSGATLADRLGEWFDTFSCISPHGETVGIAITVLAITYLTLIVGELVPKRIALVHPERIASAIAVPMRHLSVLAAPAVWVLTVSTEAVLRVIGHSGVRETTVTEDEVKSLIAEGTQSGIFVPQERAMIEGVLRLADRPVRVIMTPRMDIAWIDLGADRRAVLEAVVASRFSRLLVCDGSVDAPVGIVQTKDLLPEALRGGDIVVEKLMSHPLFISEQMTVLKLLEFFKGEKAHVAVVIDEYGVIQGLVTLTDVLEAIAGELPELGEETGPRIVQREDGTWLVDATLPIDEVEAHTGLAVLGKGRDVKTMAGFMLHHLGRLPEPGASFVYGDARFEVVDMDGRRVDKVLIEIVREEDGPRPETPAE